MKKIATYIIILLLSTVMIFFTIGAVFGINELYISFMLTLLTMHFILSYLFSQYYDEFKDK